MPPMNMAGEAPAPPAVIAMPPMPGAIMTWPKGMPKGMPPMGMPHEAAAAAIASAERSAAERAFLTSHSAEAGPATAALAARLRPAREALASARPPSSSSALASRLGSLGGSCESPGRQP